ncbi:ATP-binding cassette subfamily B multidrug efflux pump [Enterococcus sp. PF1-24]|uniref:ABC transporter ATP-binding protein n=1 Tax=unclassified Enterococcus TaxID=2608891 RepID=UPI0024735EAA|nr:MULTISPECIES: ABC transporter ATP-binding protein [unclassified Enterococcus]MDH6365506.1 ATP-binding cassette subfamily B multidrug efflux pump [Enterococcus sp. PFB1-1]MDH6402607.1 ATP-binding cassette subfamily B multidrug efflux pump [Enterococcus sp. PF1-24]
MIQLLKYAKKYRKQVILGPIFKFLEAVLELFLPLFMAKLVDQGIRQGDFQQIQQTTLQLILISIVGFACALLCQYYASIASQGFGTELRNVLMAKINHFSHEELDRFGTATLITRMTSDINQLQLALAMLIRLVVRAPFLSIGSVVMAFYIDWQMGLIFLLILPVFCLILFFIIRKSIPLYKKVQKHLDLLSQQITQNLSGVRVIRAFAGRKTEMKHFAKTTDDLAAIYKRVTNISALLSPATIFIMNLGIIALLYIGGEKVNFGNLQQGEVVALVNYMNQMLLSLIAVSDLVIIFTRAAASGNRVNEILASKNPLVEKTAPQIGVQKPTSLVTFKDVDFRYNANAGLALAGINFTIHPQEMIGITGATGSGKTTLTQLIPRFYDAAAGEITFNEVAVTDWQSAALCQQIAMVPQRAVLFSGTIRSNLAWGNTAASETDYWQALEIAQCADFVQQLPESLDTPIVEGGKNFSGGQRQRLTIARALMVQSQLLILDDSLSALDYQTDLALRQALSQKYQGAVIIISQRIRSLQQAAQIIVMDNGKIAGLGSHEKLLATCTEYQEIVASQGDQPV